MNQKSTWLCVGLISVSVLGCDTDKTLGTKDTAGTAYNGGKSGPTSSDASGDAQVPPIAFVNGQPIKPVDLQASLYELSGGQILAEVVTDQLLAQKLSGKKLTVTPELIEREKTLLLTNISPKADEAQALLNELRDRRGLGEVRFKKLLWRNAALRLFIQDRVHVEIGLLNKEYMLLYGPRSEIRLIVTSNLPGAADAIRRAQAGEAFSDLAIKLSTDVSKAQGGLLSPISSEDETYPQAIRLEMQKLKPGEISAPISLEQSFAVIKLERKIDGTFPKREDVDKDLEARVRLRAERLFMEQEARIIIREAQLTIFDPSLQKSWDLQKKRVDGGK